MTAFCELGRARIAFEAHGQGRPIVFLHGWRMNRALEIANFEPVFRARPGWRRIYLDLPGMGETPLPDWVRDQEDFLNLIMDFLDREVGDARVCMAGNSAGAYFVRGVVRARPGRLDGVILHMPKIIAEQVRRDLPPAGTLIKDAALVAALPPDQRAFGEEALVQTRAGIAAQEQKMRALVNPAIAEADSRLDAIAADPARYGFAYDVDALAEPFTRPALILTGRQDTAVGYRDAWKILDAYPRATYAAIDRADHGWPLDMTGAFRTLVEDWLDRVEEVS